jgi:uncharacterized protein (DUF305 family)
VRLVVLADAAKPLREGIASLTTTGTPTTVHPPHAPAGASRRWRRTVSGAVLAVLIFVAGYATDRARQVLSTPGDASPEAGFARDMSTHHAQAVEMAMIAWRRASDPAVRSMAYATATAQQDQIGVMQTWLANWHLLPAAGRPAMAWIPDGARMVGPDGHMPGMASQQELDRLEQASGSQEDVLFCQLMIRHHLGGLHMIDAVLAESRRSEVVALARNMKTSQQIDITNMQHMLTDLGATP